MNVFDTNVSLMERIRAGLKEKHTPGETGTGFADAIYALFKEFADDYVQEWARLNENEHMYRGDHWYGYDFAAERHPFLPHPTTPIITSTIENLKADLSDEYPDAVIVPDSYDSTITARILTKVIQQELATCCYDREYDLLVQDVLMDGWGVTEIGYDPDANNGIGSSYQRRIVNKNFMCDPQCTDIQAGRAVFKIDKRPYDWFAQHYPEHLPFMTGDDDIVDSKHDDFSAPTASKRKHSYRLIEAWFRIYDPETRKHQVHFVLLAGHQVLENSYDARPNGYFRHGMYPFVITRLYPEKGSALGFGIVDLFKDAQRYSDKLDQILLQNAFRASRPRLFIQKGMAEYDDVRDFSKEVIPVEGAPQSVAYWQDTPALPSYILTYIQMIRESIKTESGANDISRGQASGGVTAASAITALQEMSTKRSRMEARAIHYGFKEAVRMQLEVVREFSTLERKIAITVDGKEQVLPFNSSTMNRLLSDGTELPIEYYVDIRTARQTKYSKLSHNELWLQMLNTLRDRVDPVIMLEGIEADDKENMLENIRKAQQNGMLAMQKQLEEITEIAQRQAEELEKTKQALAQTRQLVMQQVEEQEADETAQLEAVKQQQLDINASPRFRSNSVLKPSDIAENLAG